MSENNDLITCSHCGSQNPSTFRFCSNCGERLDEKKEEAPVQETSFSEDAVQTPVQDPSAALGAETEQRRKRFISIMNVQLVIRYLHRRQSKKETVISVLPLLP